jgi:hypothetical protein
MKTTEKIKIMRKEKKTKVVPTQEQLDKMVMDYLKCSEKHIFQTKYVWDKEYKENYYKVLPVLINGGICFVEISFDLIDSKIDNISVKVIEINVTTKNHFGMMKNRVFPQFKNHKSIKQNKEIKERFRKILDISLNIKTKLDIESEITKILKFQ